MKRWISELQREGPQNISMQEINLVMSVVGNKSDRIDSQEVPVEKGMKIAQV